MWDLPEKDGEAMTTKQSSTVEVSRELAERIARPQLKPRDETVQRRAISELRAILAAPVEQQGEPVAYYAIETPRIVENGEVKEWMPGCIWFTPDKLLELIGPYRVTETLYRHAQPPAKIARLQMSNVVRAHMDIPGCPVLTSNQCHALAMKLNACLDEVAKLNPSE